MESQAVSDSVPGLGGVPVVTWPDSAASILPSGLRVSAVRQPGVPLVELRLWVPLGGETSEHSARAMLLGETLLTGTTERSRADIAATVQELGGTLSTTVSPDQLTIHARVINTALGPLLAVLRHVITDAAYPEDEVAGEREQLARVLPLARVNPAALAREALLHRMFGEHPCADERPEAESIEAVTADQVRQLHAQQVVPTGSALILVGDLDPDLALNQAEDALGDWVGTSPVRMRELGAVEPGAMRIAHKASAVQSAIRLGGTALRRDDPWYPALEVANLIAGGYFSSRLVRNLREDKGYCYAVTSRVEHRTVGSSLMVSADVATDVTTSALLEIWYELGRLATAPPTEEEVASAREYATGSLALAVSSQSGLASMLCELATLDLDEEWLRYHPARLAEVTPGAVAEAGRRFFAPAGIVGIILGDADAVTPGVRALSPTERF